MPGRCGYCPGRGGIPGCCVRIGCDGSGRGPPTGACGRGPEYGGRTPAAPPGRAASGCAGGRAPGAPVCPAAPPAAGRGAVGIAGRAEGRGAPGRTTRGAPAVGSGGVGAVGRCSSMRRRSVGGTTRPAAGGLGAAGGASAGGGAVGCGCTCAAGCEAGAAATGAGAGGSVGGAARGAGGGALATAGSVRSPFVFTMRGTWGSAACTSIGGVCA